MQTKMIGMILKDRYRIEKLVGGGGVATVYSGTDLKTNQPVAIKQLLDTAKQADEAQIERFERESHAMQKLTHPNIVNVYDTIFLESDHFIVMEYVDGGTLSDLLKKDLQPISQVLQIAHDIASAMALVHDQDIIHRDIKPENILLTQAGRAKLTDFGMARFTYMSRLTNRNMTVGTMMYMAPEQFKTGEAVKESDIWAFGITIYEILTHERPFPMPHLVVSSPHIPAIAARPDTPQAFSDFIDELLEKNYRQRPRDFEDIVDQLNKLMA